MAPHHHMESGMEANTCEQPSEVRQEDLYAWLFKSKVESTRKYIFEVLIFLCVLRIFFFFFEITHVTKIVFLRVFLILRR